MLKIGRRATSIRFAFRIASSWGRGANAPVGVTFDASCAALDKAVERIVAKASGAGLFFGCLNAYGDGAAEGRKRARARREAKRGPLTGGHCAHETSDGKLRAKERRVRRGTKLAPPWTRRQGFDGFVRSLEVFAAGITVLSLDGLKPLCG